MGRRDLVFPSDSVAVYDLHGDKWMTGSSS
jgi:hypothetical protein